MILGNRRTTPVITESLSVQGATYPTGTPMSVILQAISDAQTIELNQKTLSIEGGNSVDFKSVELQDAFEMPLQDVLVP